MRNIGQFPDKLHLILLPQPKRPWWKRWLKQRRKFSVAEPFDYRMSDRLWKRWLKRRRKFSVAEPFDYRMSGGFTITAQKGTIVDGASIPCFFWRVIGQPMGDYAEASVIHDWLWSVSLRRLEDGRPADFDWANAVFYEAMATLGVGRLRRWLMWAAVSLNGRLVVWKYSRKLSARKARLQKP